MWRRLILDRSLASVSDHHYCFALTDAIDQCQQSISTAACGWNADDSTSVSVKQSTIDASFLPASVAAAAQLTLNIINQFI